MNKRWTPYCNAKEHELMYNVYTTQFSWGESKTKDGSTSPANHYKCVYIYIKNPKRGSMLNTETVECTAEWLVHLCVCIKLLIVLVHYRCCPVLYEYNMVTNRDFYCNDFREDFDKFFAFVCQVAQSSYCCYFMNEHPRKSKGA